jgi:hypothetical protein
MERCRIVEIAEELVSEVEVKASLRDFYHGGGLSSKMLDHIRHNYTNYEQLLDCLPLCDDFWDEYGTEYCDQVIDDVEPEGPCPLKEQAHHILQSATTDAAEAACYQWLATRNKKAP